MLPLYPSLLRLQIPIAITSALASFLDTGSSVPRIVDEGTALDFVEALVWRRFDSLDDVRAASLENCLVYGSDTESMKISQAREMRERIFALSGSDSRTLVIVSRADALTHDAGTSLLKTLEDTPTGIFFLLSVERAESLLPTIRSRCIDVRAWVRHEKILDEAIETALRKYCSGNPAPLLQYLFSHTVQREEAIIMLARTIRLLSDFSLYDADFPSRVSDALVALQTTNVSSRSILDTVFLSDALLSERPS